MHVHDDNLGHARRYYNFTGGATVPSLTLTAL